MLITFISNKNARIWCICVLILLPPVSLVAQLAPTGFQNDYLSANVHPQQKTMVQNVRLKRIMTDKCPDISWVYDDSTVLYYSGTRDHQPLNLFFLTDLERIPSYDSMFTYSLTDSTTILKQSCYKTYAPYVLSELIETNHYDGFNMTWKYTFETNENDSLSQEFDHYFSDEDSLYMVYSQKAYFYEDNKLMEVIYSFTNDAGQTWKELRRWDHYYNGRGDLIQLDNTQLYGAPPIVTRYLYKYSNDHKLTEYTESKIFNEEWESMYRYVYQYNQDGSLSEFEKQHADSSSIEVFNYEYDDHGLLIKLIWTIYYQSEIQTTRYWEATYNENLLPSTIVFYSVSESGTANPMYRYRFEYEEFYDTSEIDQTGKVYSMEISPNPAGQIVELTLVNDLAETAKLNVYSLGGTKIYSRNITLLMGENTIPIYLSPLSMANGEYIISVASGTKLYSGKFVKH